jgi:hypothetical protein
MTIKKGRKGGEKKEGFRLHVLQCQKENKKGETR